MHQPRRIGYVHEMTTRRRSIAVIGSGVAGLTAAHELAKRDRITLFEADTRFGGHAHTHHVDGGNGEIVAVDSAFLVHNDRTYPTLCRMFDELGVATRDTDMSMSVRCDTSGLEYAGARGFGGLFPTLRNLARPRYLAMLAEVRTFHRAATQLLRGDRHRRSNHCGNSLPTKASHGFFIEHFITPLVAAVWSCPPTAALDYPARYLFTFLDHHGMLTVFGSPVWRTVVGGSGTYVDAITNRLDEVHTGTRVEAVRRVSDGVQIVAAGEARQFDAVVVATHSDQALALLAEPTPARARRARRHAVLDQPRQAAHRRIGATAAQAGTGVLELSDGRPAKRGDGDLRHQPADAVVGAEALSGHPGRPRLRRPGQRAGRDDLSPPALHTGIRCRATAAADAGRRPGGVRRGVPRLGIPRGRCRIGTARRQAPATGP